MSDATRESIAANLEKRADEMWSASEYDPVRWRQSELAEWLRELAAEVRAGEL